MVLPPGRLITALQLALAMVRLTRPELTPTSFRGIVRELLYSQHSAGVFLGDELFLGKHLGEEIQCFTGLGDCL